MATPLSPPQPAPPLSKREDRVNPDPRASPWVAVKAFLSRHPILCLALLSPGIPEYLSSSSALSTVLAAPPLGVVLFFLQLAGNLGLYLPGVLLIREAMIRWNKGWGSVLLLGAAYGILEEGIALETLFYSRAGPVGAEGFYGHWLGVNWVWTAGILFVHIIFSISLPILLLGLALPKTRGKSLVGTTGVRWAFVVWAIDIPVLMIVVRAIYHYWMGWPIFFGSLVVIGLLVLAAFRAPANLLPTRSGPPRVTPFRAALIGVAFFPPILLFESFLGYWKVPPALTILVIVAYEFCLGFLVVRAIGTVENERQLVALAAGVLAVIGFIGFVAELPIPVTIVADLAAFWFLRHLWKKYTPLVPRATGPVPPGALASG
ncbi:MAG: hypothetical protein WA688_02325 [Thermoplasmata archaeon]